MKKILVYTGVLDNDSQSHQKQKIFKKWQINEQSQDKKDDPYIDEPNYLIELPRTYQQAQEDIYEDQFRRVFDPEQIYDSDYTSKLDESIADQFLLFAQAIQNFQKYDPQGYKNNIEQTHYGVILNMMLQAKQKQTHAYQFYQNIMGDQLNS